MMDLGGGGEDIVGERGLTGGSKICVFEWMIFMFSIFAKVAMECDVL